MLKNNKLPYTPNQHSFISNTLTNTEYSIIESDVKVQVEEDTVIKIGDNFNITGRELKTCLKFLLEQATQAYPEEFI